MPASVGHMQKTEVYLEWQTVDDGLCSPGAAASVFPGGHPIPQSHEAPSGGDLRTHCHRNACWVRRGGVADTHTGGDGYAC